MDAGKKSTSVYVLIVGRGGGGGGGRAVGGENSWCRLSETRKNLLLSSASNKDATRGLNKGSILLYFDEDTCEIVDSGIDTGRAKFTDLFVNKVEDFN